MFASSSAAVRRPAVGRRRRRGVDRGGASVALAPPASAATTTLYASPSGTGTSCSATQPCSLAAAQAAVRSQNGTMSGDIVVQLADGVYRLSAPLRLTAADSGTNGYTRAVAGGPVGASGDQRRPGGHRLVGGRRRQEHLAGQRRAPASTPGSSTSTARSPPGRARR